MPLRRSLFTAAVLSLGAGVVHVAAMFSHLQESAALAVAFGVVAVLQLALGGRLLVRRPPSRRLLGAGALLQLAAVVAWGLSRTMGLPFGGEGVEAVMLPDVVAVVLQLGAVIVLALAALEPVAARPRIPKHALAVAVATATLAMGVTSVAVAGLADGHHTDGHADGHAADADHVDDPSAPAHSHDD